MYTLRTVIDNVQFNQEIGSIYSVVDKESNYEEFSRLFEMTFKFKHSDDNLEKDNFSQNCYAILTAKCGEKLIPLYLNQSNYVMTENGKTFSNLTFK